MRFLFGEREKEQGGGKRRVGRDCWFGSKANSSANNPLPPSLPISIQKSSNPEGGGGEDITVD